MIATIEVPLTRGYRAVIDAADADLVLPYRWHAIVTKRSAYAGRAVRVADGPRRQRLLFMHTLLTGYAITDHRDGDGLNNRRVNLRAADRTANSRNRQANKSASRFKGVHINRGRGLPWKSAIKAGGPALHLGYFGSEAEAARAYDAAARQHFGEFAAVNFPAPGERCAVAPRVVA